ncbi:MAG: hypothetical protein KAW47_08920 [Thermoplasmatales archaeon]|nr:hypothetical protein [Thermoplasmatales archaeon]
MHGNHLTWNRVGSSSADGDLTVHKYTWDFDATVESKLGMDPNVDDMDRSGTDEMDDELDAEGSEVTHEFCVGKTQNLIKLSSVEMQRVLV